MCELIIERNRKTIPRRFKAPWRMERPYPPAAECEGSPLTYININTGFDEIASIYAAPPGGEREACAFLIAKAPEMFDLLDEVVGNTDLNAIQSPLLRDWFDRAFKVLAQARGEIA